MLVTMGEERVVIGRRLRLGLGLRSGLRLGLRLGLGSLLGCHGTREVLLAGTGPRDSYACPVRAVRGALGASGPAPLVRTVRRGLVREARTRSAEAPGRLDA